MAKKQSKSRKQQQQNTNQLLWMGGVIVVLTLVALAVVAFSGSQAPAPTADGETVAALPDASVSPQRISPAQYIEYLQDSDHVLIDVRTPGEFSGGHIEGAGNINSVEAANRLDEFPRDQTIVLYCNSGNRSGQVAQMLRQAGFTNVYDLGGIQTWTSQGYPTVR